jgi:hypothetical protein
VDLAYQHYLHGEFSDQFAGGAAADVVLGIMPGVVDWLFLENYSQIRKDALAADTPTNRDNISYFTTGPRVTMPLGDVSQLLIGGEYSLDSYGGNTLLDSTRLGGRVELIRNLSDASSLSVKEFGERRRFDNQTAFNQNYDTQSASLAYRLAGSRTDVGAEVGYEQISVDSQPRASGGLLARLALRRQTSRSSSIGLNVYREYSDAGRSLRSTQNINGVSEQTGQILAAGDAFIRKAARATWSQGWSRTSIELMGEFAKEEHDYAPTFNRNIRQSSVRMTRQLRRNLNLNAEVQESIEKFQVLDLQVREIAGVMSVDWRRSDMLLVRWAYEYHRRSGDSPVAKYNENRTSLFFVWNAFRER